MSVLVLVNPRAGAGRRRHAIAERVRALFPTGDVELAVPASREELRARAAGAASCGTRMVVVVGGDGTIREAASGLIGSGTVLGILPLGSGNGFARGLGIGVSAKRALDVLRSGRDLAVDVGTVNGLPFFNLSGIGFDAVVGEVFNRGSVRGMLPYFGITARESLLYRRVEVSIRLDDREIVTPVFLVTVANLNQFGGGAIIAPGADPSDGFLDIVVIRKLSVFELMIHAPKLFDGSVRDLPALETYRSRAFRIVRAHRGPLHLDGDPVELGHVLDYGVRPRALLVRVPRMRTASGSERPGNL